MPGPGGKANPNAAPKLRLDKWLWQARFFKTRADAAEAIGAGKVRVNGARVNKPGHSIAVQDVLTFALGAEIRLIRITGLSMRRGPFSEAQSLYVDMNAMPRPLE